MFSAPAMAEKRVALVIGNSVYENAAPLANPANDATAMTAMLEASWIRDRRIPAQSQDCRNASRVSRLRRQIARCRYRGGLLCRSRHRDRRHQLHRSGRRGIGAGPRCIRRGVSAGADPGHDRAGEAASPCDPRCLPRQPACQEYEAGDRLARHRPRPRQGGAVEPEHADRLRVQGRFDRFGRRQQEQPVHDSPGQTPRDARPRSAQGVRLRPRRGPEEHRQPAGALCLRLARWRRFSAGSGETRRHPPNSAQADTRRDYELAERVGTREVWTAFLTQYPDDCMQPSQEGS